MANIYKVIPSEDVANVNSLLHEAVPIDGSIFDYQNVYGTYPDNTNVERMYHGMFQRVYDYPYTNSSSNHIFDLTFGVEPSLDVNSWVNNGYSYSYDETKDSFKDKKNNIYNVLAQTLLGYDKDGNIRKFNDLVGLFDEGNVSGIISTVGSFFPAVVPISFSRLLGKDGVKKGTFSMVMGMHPSGKTFGSPSTTPVDDYQWDGTNDSSSYIKIYDAKGGEKYFTDSPAGDYGILYAIDALDASGTEVTALPTDDYALMPSLLDTTTFRVPVGFIFYQVGIIILTPHLFIPYSGVTGGNYGLISNANGNLDINGFYMLFDSTGSYVSGTNPTDSGVNGFYDIAEILMGQENPVGSTDDINISIDSFCDALRQRVVNISFVNSIEINSTIYLCRLGHNDFNYSSNPTYLQDSRIVVKDESTDEPISYITGVGLYSPDNALLAVGKFSEPLKKTPSTSFSIRARLDY